MHEDLHMLIIAHTARLAEAVQRPHTLEAQQQWRADAKGIVALLEGATEESQKS